MRAFLLTVFCLLLGGSPLAAATLDFNVYPRGKIERPLTFSTAAVSESSGGALFVYGSGDFGMPVGGGVCALKPGFSCTGDMSLLFVGPVSNLSFKGFSAAPSDKATIAVYAGDALVDFLLISGNPNDQVAIDLGRTSGITRVEIANLSGIEGKGIAYGDFDFDVDTPDSPPPRPLPPLALNLDAFPGGINAGNIDLGPAVLVETSGGKIFVYRTGNFGMPQNGGFCAILADSSCMGDLVLELDAPASDLIFSGFFAKPTDSATISLFDGDVLVHTGKFFGNSSGTIRFDFRDVTRLTKIQIVDSSKSSSRGIAYGDFRYRAYQGPVTPVPLPAPLLLLGAGLAALALAKLAARHRARAA